MAHQEQQKFFQELFRRFPKYFNSPCKILEVGSQNINGSVREFFPDTNTYLGIDLGLAKDVDWVIPGELIELPDGWADIVISTECFEHCKDWDKVLINMIRIAASGGVVIITCASTGRPTHGTIDSNEYMSPFTTHYYKNLGIGDFSQKIATDFYFTSHAFEINSVSKDLYFWGIRSESSIHSVDDYWEDPQARLARAQGQLGQAADRQAAIQAELDRTRHEALQAKAESDLAKAELDRAKAEVLQTRKSTEYIIDQLYSSSSWKITSPLRRFGDFSKKSRLFIRQKADNKPGIAAKLDFIEGDGCSGPIAVDHTESNYVLSGRQEELLPCGTEHDSSKIIAFYLPQYHRIKENDDWWGPGFTEWTNVVKAKKNFADHYQPHLPRELGFYDLSNSDMIREQAEMAKLYGVHAFCFYYYWFSGRKILQKPIDNFLASDTDLNYCLCWANENWTRTWDGDVNSVLLEQKYAAEDPEEFIKSLLPHFADKRYIRVDNKPMLVVYRAKDIPHVKSVFQRWREIVSCEGYPGLHIAVVDFYDISDPSEVDADALVEFPPHKFNGSENIPDHLPSIANSKFSGSIIDYRKIIAQSIARKCPHFSLYRGLIPSWDNTARRQNTPLIVNKSSPRLFKYWLDYARRYTSEHFNGKSDNFIFINAWNEWGEGCHLEPDQKWGLAFLDAIKSSEWFTPSTEPLEDKKLSLIRSLVREWSDNQSIIHAFETSYLISEGLPAKRQACRTYIYKIKKALKKVPLLPDIAKSIASFF